MPPPLRSEAAALPLTAIGNAWDFAAPPIAPGTLRAVGHAVRNAHLLRFDHLTVDGRRPAPHDPHFPPPPPAPCAPPPPPSPPAAPLRTTPPSCPRCAASRTTWSCGPGAGTSSRTRRPTGPGPPARGGASTRPPPSPPTT